VPTKKVDLPVSAVMAVAIRNIIKTLGWRAGWRHWRNPL